MILTKEFILKRIKEQEEYIRDKIVDYSYYNNDVNYYKHKRQTINEHIHQAISQKKYFEDLLNKCTKDFIVI